MPNDGNCIVFHGYHLRKSEAVALRRLSTKSKTLRIAILEGPPGVGKTYFTECLARHIGAEYMYVQCHNWTSDEDLFVSVHVGRIAAGVDKPEDAYEMGVLAKAAQASQQGQVVVCIDELDKAPMRAEALLLDFLQHGRVFGPARELYQGDLRQLVVIITTNGIRPLMEATMRRGFRVQMGFLPPNVEAEYLRKAAGLPQAVNRVIVRMANVIREKGETKPSLQEMTRLAEDLRDGSAQSAADVECLLHGWLVKEPRDWNALVEVLKAETNRTPQDVLWSEYTRGSK